MQNKKYDLIINSDFKNQISKKYFYQKYSKNYNSTAYTTIINHKLCKNKSAAQIFTKFGPLAFLPISVSNKQGVQPKELSAQMELTPSTLSSLKEEMENCVHNYRKTKKH